LLQAVGGVPSDVLDAARVLDRHYIPTRYPNGFAAGAPMDYYDAPPLSQCWGGKKGAQEAVSYAETILAYVAARL